MEIFLIFANIKKPGNKGKVAVIQLFDINAPGVLSYQYLGFSASFTSSLLSVLLTIFLSLITFPFTSEL